LSSRGVARYARNAKGQNDHRTNDPRWVLSGFLGAGSRPSTPPEAQEQLAFAADVILLNKTDLVSTTQLAQVQSRIAGINPYATLHHTERCNVELSKVLGKDAFNLDRILELEPGFLNEAHQHEHDDQIASVSPTANNQ
jgi:G3E family GTPase